MGIIEDLQTQLGESNGSVEEMQCIFYETAKELMNDYVLKIGDNLEIKLKELEFYYYDDEKHPDCYTHNHERQRTTKGQLYVHRKGHTYGGVDITFGNGEYYGGILIRGIKIKDKFISGPNKVKQYLVKNLMLTSEEELENILISFQPKRENKDNNFKQDNKNNNLYIYSRHGLSGKFCKFKNALYRFFAEDYFNETKNIDGRDSIKNIGKIRAVSSFVFNTDEKYATDISLIKDYCKEQNCKYHLCYYMESLKNKLQNNECNKIKGH